MCATVGHTVEGGVVTQTKVCATVGHTVEGGVITQAQLWATVGHTVEGGVVTQPQLCATVGHTVEGGGVTLAQPGAGVGAYKRGWWPKSCGWWRVPGRVYCYQKVESIMRLIANLIEASAIGPVTQLKWVPGERGI